MIDKARTNFNSAIEHFQQELKKLRTGRPSPEMFENIEVDAYGSRSKLSGVGTINVVDATLVTVQPWDKTLLQSIAKGIQAAPGQYNPQISGDMIRIPIPAMTQERRQESVKKVGELSENARIQIRMSRKDIISELDSQKKSSALTEDEHSSALKQLQELVDDSNKKIEELAAEKEQILLTV